MGIPLCVICCFSLAVFTICSLCLIFVNLIDMCLGVFRLGFILFGTLFLFGTLWVSGFLHSSYFLPHFREVFSYYVLEYFLMAFLFVLFFWDSYDSNVGAFHIVPEVREVVLISFDSFFLSASFISTILSSTSLILFLSLLFYSWFPPECFLFHLLHYSFLIDSFLFLLGPC